MEFVNDYIFLIHFWCPSFVSVPLR